MSTFPWEKQEWETPKAYRAFELYRDLGPDRTLQATIRRFVEVFEEECTQSRGGKVTKPPSRSGISKWSMQYRWVDRVRQYDEWVIENQKQQKRELAKLEWELKVQRIRERHESIAQHMTETAELGFREIAAYLRDTGNIEAAIEGRSGKGLSALISALKQVAESGTALDERSLGVDAMMIEYENGQKEE